MKQNIDIQQYSELDDVQKRRMLEWWNPIRGDLFFFTDRNLVLIVEAASDEGIESIGELIPKQKCEPLLSIGQMIQYILSRSRTWQFISDCIQYDCIQFNREFADSLWEAVKLELANPNY
ncbi:hypothetical protein [Fontibacillus sp. BL9]|uniref:hypothetical protein n=1 Tax=Fontibacillus sp. BL9 TaxID=3389971 RepID=UPI003978089B